MEKRLSGVFLPLMIILGFLGYKFVGTKTASLSAVYFSATIISLLLLFVCMFTVKQKKKWFILLFTSVFIVNTGYTFLSISPSLEAALWANRLSYLGSVFLPFFMLMIILEATNTRIKKLISYFLFGVSILIFLVAASPGILDIYYKNVSFSIINGVSVLLKVYGPLHPIYMFYLLGYFSAMVAVIVRSYLKKTIDTTSNAVVLAISVLVNIGVWLIEQLANIDFEFLSVSYIISELFLLGIHLVMNENALLKELLQSKEADIESAKNIQNVKKNEIKEKIFETKEVDIESKKEIYSEKENLKKNDNKSLISSEEMELFNKGVEKLTPTEKFIYEAYLCGTSTKDIMNDLNIKENTLKFHNKNIYGKLGVSSRKRLLEIYKSINEKSNEE